eukprot:TRINITY_DN6047_c1_g2_i1.p1 TRINITY_DN6047_c1_g2~~TRINITY_DN6047_c1_g2_i1.p1  ORF type:complete len:709 (+),score=172.90 TRINITY_DN6047_c1_g2_i1:59-2185(+)
MDIGLVACVHNPPKEVGGRCLTTTPDSISFDAPKGLREAGFPHSDAKFAFDNVYENPDSGLLYKNHLSKVGAELLDRQNAVIFVGGKRATPKRQLTFGNKGDYKSGIAYSVLKDTTSHPEFANYTYKATCYTMGNGKDITDLLNLSNDAGIMRESLKGPPVVSGVTERSFTKWSELQDILKTINENYFEHYAGVMELPQESEPFPKYQPENIMLSIRLFDDEENKEEDEDEVGVHVDLQEDLERNSITFVVLGDSERPALCGIDQGTLSNYEEQQKTLSAIVGVLGAIRCKRLRVPFGKCRLMHLLKRAYNSEKKNPYNNSNKPTFSLMVLNTLSDGRNAEESYHSLVFAKRIVNVVGGSSVGPASRDLAIERWRLEQDIVELKDELEIVKTVHGYKPVIYNQPKPVQNIKEEEAKRINNIESKREKERKEQIENMRLVANKEAKEYIDGEQKKTNQNIQKLESMLSEKTKQNAELNQQRETKIKEFEKQLEKVRKKRQDEEEKTEKLRKEMEQIEVQLEERRTLIAKQKEQLELLSKDHSKGREMILKSRMEAKAKREKIAQDRVQQREKWVAEIRQTNEKALQLVRELDKLRAESGRPKQEDTEDEDFVKDEIKKLDSILGTMISLEDNGQPPQDSDNRKKEKLEAWFDEERIKFEKKLAREQKKERRARKGHHPLPLPHQRTTQPREERPNGRCPQKRETLGIPP